MTPSTPEVGVAFAGLKRERPPLVRLFFDVRLRNGAGGARWFLLPGEPAPLLARFAAAHGDFLGVLLSAAADALLRRVPFAFWGDPPERLEVEFVRALRVAVDGEDIAAWLGGEVVTEAGASGDAGSARRVLRRHSDDFSEYPLELDEEERRRIVVPLA